MHFTLYKSVPVATSAQALELSGEELSLVAGGVGSAHIPTPDRSQEHHPTHPARPGHPAKPAHPVLHTNTATNLQLGHTSH